MLQLSPMSNYQPPCRPRDNGESLPSLTTIYCPLIDFPESGANIGNQEPSETRLRHVPASPGCPAVECERSAKPHITVSGFSLSYLLTAGPHHEGAADNTDGFKHPLSSLLLLLKKYNNEKSLTSPQICVNLCIVIMNTLQTTLEQCMCMACSVVIPPVYFIRQTGCERSRHWRLPHHFTL